VVGPELTLKIYGKRNPFGLEVKKDCFTGKTVIEDLVDETTQKRQQTWKSNNTVRYGSHWG